MPIPTVCQLGQWNSVTDAFTAHPSNPNGTILDLNDGTTLTLVGSGTKGDGLNWGMPEPDVFTSFNPRVVGTRVIRKIYVKNRKVIVKIFLGGSASYAAWIAALRALIQTCEGITAQQPGALKVQTTAAATAGYFDVVEAHVKVVYDELLWMQLADEGIEVILTCKPFFRYPLTQLQNLVINPGFEVPSGPGFTAFNDPLANANAYTTVAGATYTAYAAQVLADAPAGFWRLNEPSGTVANDRSGINADNGTITGTGVTYGQTAPTTGDSTAAAMAFDGAAGAVGSITNPLAGNDLSLECWLKTSAAGAGSSFVAGSGVISGVTGVNQSDYGIALTTGGKISCGTGGAAGTTYSAQVVADSAVLYYRLGESASPLAPTAGSGNLTVGGSGTIFNTTGALVSDANGSVTLNGSGTIQGTATTPSSISGTWAVECWIKNGGTGKIWGGRGSSDIGSDCQINASGATAVHLFFRNGGSNAAFDTNFTWPGSGWSHIVVNATATTWELWINNVKVNNGALTFSPILINDGSSGFLNIGWNGIAGDPHWTSGIDELAVYTANLGSSTINTHYTIGTTGPATSDTTATTAAAWNDGAWHHVVMTRVKSSGAIVLYVDGTSRATATGGTTTLSAPTMLTFARQQSGGNFLACQLAEVAVYNTALSATQVSNHYAMRNGTGTNTGGGGPSYAATVTTDSASLYYRMGDMVGSTTLTPTIGTGTATISGTVTLGQTGAISGDANTAALFDGSTGYATVTPSSPATVSGTFSVEIWAKNGTTGKLLGARSTEGGTDFMLNVGNPQIHCTVGDGTGVRVLADVAITMPNTAWWYIVYTFTSSTWICYLNGTQVGTGATGFTPVLYNGSHPLSIGWNGISNPGADPKTSGTLDEIAIYNGTALTATQVANHYAIAIAGPTGGTTPIGSNTLALAAGTTLACGSAAWSAINTWRVRFLVVAGATSTWTLHYQDASNATQVVMNGATMVLSQKVAGVTTTLASVAAALTAGTWYWLRVTQFPAANTSTGYRYAPLVQSVLYADAGGSVAGSLATVGPVALGSAAAAVSGNLRLATTGGTLVLGGPYTNTHQVTLFGPGGWLTNLAQSSATGQAAASWDTATTYASGPVQSGYAARIDAPPAGTWTAAVTNFAGGAPNGTAAIAALANTSYSVLARTRSTGISASATQQLIALEYDVNGTLLRTGTTLTLTGPQASWTTLSGSWTTGANTAWLGVQLRGVDTSVPGASAGGMVWFDNVQCWPTALGATMPYCEMRFPSNVGQVVLSGLLGDVASPAMLAVGINSGAGITPGASYTVYAGRRQSVGYAAPLVGPAVLSSPDGTNNSMVLDSNAFGGYQTQFRNAGANYAPLYFSGTVRDYSGTYHLLTRVRMQDGAPTTQNLSSLQYLLLNPWLGNTTKQDRYALVQGTAAYPWSAQNAWTIADVGQVVAPAAPLGSLTDPTQVLATTAAQSTTASTGMDVDWGALVPVDGEILTAIFANNASGVTLPNWIWVYFDGLGQQSGQRGTATWSLEPTAISNPGHAAGGPGAASQVPALTSVADTAPRVDPSLATVNGAAVTRAVNQWVVAVTTSNNTFAQLAIDVAYWPMFLAPR